MNEPICCSAVGLQSADYSALLHQLNQRGFSEEGVTVLRCRLFTPWQTYTNNYHEDRVEKEVTLAKLWRRSFNSVKWTPSTGCLGEENCAMRHKGLKQ